MLIKNLIKFTFILGLIVVLLSGCGFYGPEEAVEIDPPQVELDTEIGEEVTLEVTDLNSEQPTSEINSTQEAQQEIQLTIYYFDEHNDVVPLTLDIPKVEGIGQQVLRYMTVGGPAEEILPPGFRPVLPEGTSFTMNVKPDEKLAIVDFSKEFLNYEANSPNDEKKILEAITWSLTEFPTVEKVEIRVNGYILEVMPVWNTPVVGPLSRIDGINLELANNINIGQTTPVILYFNRTNQNNNYLVPITRLVTKTNDIAKVTLEQLIIGPKPNSNLTSSLLPTTKILDVKVSDQLVVADFDEEILGFNNELSNELINMIVWSLSENTDVPSIQIKIKGETKLLPESLAKPILRPQIINATMF